MGNCASSSQEAEGKARSDLIDRQIEEDSKRYKRECKILLLGASPIPSFFLFFFAKSGFLFHRANGGSSSDRVTHVDDGRQRDSSFDISHVTGPIIHHNIIACPPNRTTSRRTSKGHFLISGYGHTTHSPIILSFPMLDAEYVVRIYAHRTSLFIRLRRVRKVDHRQANEDNPPEWLQSRRAHRLPTTHLEKSPRERP